MTDGGQPVDVVSGDTVCARGLERAPSSDEEPRDEGRATIFDFDETAVVMKRAL